MEALFYYLPFLVTIRDFIELGGPVLLVIGAVTLFRTPELKQAWSMAVSPLILVMRSPIFA